MPDIVAPSAGEINATVGGVVSGLATVTDTVAETVVLPALSYAFAVRLYVPLGTKVVFQLNVYGDAAAKEVPFKTPFA